MDITKVTSVTFDPEAACELDVAELITGNVGAYAEINANVDVVGPKAGPSVIVALFSVRLPLKSQTTIKPTKVHFRFGT